jgi:hypothetical protein
MRMLLAEKRSFRRNEKMKGRRRSRKSYSKRPPLV